MGFKLGKSWGGRALCLSSNLYEDFLGDKGGFTSKVWTGWGWEWWDVLDAEVGSGGASLGGKRPYCEVVSSSTLRVCKPKATTGIRIERVFTEDY